MLRLVLGLIMLIVFDVGKGVFCGLVRCMKLFLLVWVIVWVMVVKLLMMVLCFVFSFFLIKVGWMI